MKRKLAPADQALSFKPILTLTMKTHTYRSPVTLLLWLLSGRNQLVTADESFSQIQQSAHRASQSARILDSESIITSTSCQQIRRQQPYSVRLELFYYYSIEYTTSDGSVSPKKAPNDNDGEHFSGDVVTSPNSQFVDGHDIAFDLSSIATAVAYAVAFALNDCDETGRPVYAVDVSAQSSLEHMVSTNGTLL
jgi:hypothetical protein